MKIETVRRATDCFSSSSQISRHTVDIIDKPWITSNKHYKQPRQNCQHQINRKM